MKVLHLIHSTRILGDLDPGYYIMQPVDNSKNTIFAPKYLGS